MPLTARQELFAIEYLKDLNATQAAIRAGYSADTAYSIGSENLSKPEIADAIAEAAAKRNQRVEIAGDFVLSELHALADADLSAIFNEDGTIKPVHEMPVRVRKSISSIEVEELFGDDADTELEGQPLGGALRRRRKVVIGHVRKIKFWSKDRALELLARHKSLLNDKLALEHSGEIGGRFYDDEERMSKIDAILAAIERRTAGDAELDGIG